jgi:hypothetical protein
MTPCAIRYRLDGPGPATFLVECNGELRVYAKGALGAVVPQSRVLASLASRGVHWIPAVGEIELDLNALDQALHYQETAGRIRIDLSVIPGHQADAAGPA